MNITRFIAESTIDYRGHLGPTVFVSGCNFRCGFCHNGQLLDNSTIGFNENELFRKIELKVLAGWYNSICISGGEPTIDKELIGFIRKAKALGLKVKLDTNGSNPDVLEKILEQTQVDYIAMDIKCPRQLYPSIVGVDIDLTKIDASIDLVKRFRDYEFRTTVLPFLTLDNFREMGNWISNPIKAKRYVLQQFSPENALKEEYRQMIPKTKQEIQELAQVMDKYAKEIIVDA